MPGMPREQACTRLGCEQTQVPYHRSFIDYSSAPTDSSSASTAKNEAGQARVLLGERRKHEGKKMVGFAFPWPNVLASLVSTYRLASDN